MKLKPIPLKPCPYCGGKMEIKQSWSKLKNLKEALADHSNSVWDFPEGDLSLIPTCKDCKTEYPKVSVLNLSEEIYDMMMTKLLNEWRK